MQWNCLFYPCKIKTKPANKKNLQCSSSFHVHVFLTWNSTQLRVNCVYTNHYFFSDNSQSFIRFNCIRVWNDSSNNLCLFLFVIHFGLIFVDLWTNWLAFDIGVDFNVNSLRQFFRFHLIRPQKKKRSSWLREQI